MERVEIMLYEAAFEGSVTKLLDLLQQDRLILNRVPMNSPSETPLHIAALLGHVDFVKEILRRKPELAEELDYRKSSALHIASQKGYVEIVKALLQANPEMCFARDIDGRNPLHLAAMKGRIDVLGELLGTRPHAASSTTVFGETILHFCVKYNQLEALKFLVENIYSPEMLNAEDDYGMTILHLAVADKQIEVVKYLTTRTTINVNALNANGVTTLDILAQSRRDVKDWEIGESLRRAGAISAKDNIYLSRDEHASRRTKSLTFYGNNKKKQGKGFENIHKNEDDWLEKMRNALMVVASLIATIAFQAATNPPSLVKDTCQFPTIASQAVGATANPPQISRLWVYPYTEDAFSSEPPIAQFMPSSGRDDNFHFSFFLSCNTIGFTASLSIIFLLVSGLPLNRRPFTWILMIITWIAIIAMAVAYLINRNVFNAASNHVKYPLIALWIISLVTILLLGHLIRITVKITKYIRILVRRLRKNPAREANETTIAPIV